MGGLLDVNGEPQTDRRLPAFPSALPSGLSGVIFFVFSPAAFVRPLHHRVTAPSRPSMAGGDARQVRMDGLPAPLRGSACVNPEQTDKEHRNELRRQSVQRRPPKKRTEKICNKGYSSRITCLFCSFLLFPSLSCLLFFLNFLFLLPVELWEYCPPVWSWPGREFCVPGRRQVRQPRRLMGWRQRGRARRPLLCK